jgi:hypothetical protein
VVTDPWPALDDPFQTINPANAAPGSRHWRPASTSHHYQDETPHFGGAATGCGNGIGRMLAMRQPAAVFTSV